MLTENEIKEYFRRSSVEWEFGTSPLLNKELVGLNLLLLFIKNDIKLKFKISYGSENRIDLNGYEDFNPFKEEDLSLLNRHGIRFGRNLYGHYSFYMKG